MFFDKKKLPEVYRHSQNDVSVVSSTPKNLKSGLTKKQLLIFNFIKDFIIEHKYSPSYEEMQIALGYKSKSAIHSLVINLHRRGWINRKIHGGRSITINN